MVFLVCIAGCHYYGRAQGMNADSIRQVISQTTDPERKFSAVLALCSVRKTLPTDTLDKYVHMARELSRTQGSQLDKYYAEFYFSSFLMNKGFLDSAIHLIDEYTPHLGSSTPERTLFIRSSFLKINTFVRKNQFRDALKGYYSILNQAQALNDTMSLAMARNGLGWVHMEMGQYRNAITWLMEGLRTQRDSVFYQKYSYVYSNLACLLQFIVHDGFCHILSHTGRLQVQRDSMTSKAWRTATIFLRIHISSQTETQRQKHC